MDYIKPTHTVASGKLKHNVYIDGRQARCVATGRILATQSNDGKWSQPLRELRYKSQPLDSVKSLGNTAVTVELSKGRFY